MFHNEQKVLMPHLGLRFAHAFWTTGPNHRPMVFRVTRIARGTVWYRPVDGGLPMYCAVEEFPRYARPYDEQERNL